MPVARYQLPDGRIARFDVPEGTTPEQARGMAAQFFRQPEKQAAPEQPLPGPLDRFLIGAGRGMVATGQGIKQAALHAFGSEEDAAAYDEKIRREEALYRPLAERSKLAGAGELVGGVAATAPTMLIPGAQAALPARLASYAAQGALGAATQPVTGEGDYLSQKAGQAALGAGMGAGVGGAVYGAGKAVEALLPQNVAGRVVNVAQRKAMEAPVGQEGARLVRETGIELTPAARSGSKVATFAENMARQSAFTMEKAAVADRKIADQAISRINNIMGRMKADDESAETVGNMVLGGIKTAATKIDDLRAKQAATDYGAVRKMAGDKPVISYTNLVDEANKIISEYENVGGSDAARIVSQAKSLAGKLGKREEGMIILPGGQKATSSPMMTTVDQAMKTRRFYSKAAAGGANVFEDIHPSENRRLSARLLGAIERDFDQAAGGEGDIAAALKTANQNYRKFSQSIDYVAKSTLGRMVGDDLVDAAFTGGGMNTTAAEKFAQRFKTMTPSELKIATGILQEHSPDALQSVRRWVVSDALQKGMDIPVSAGVSGPKLSPNKFINALLPDENMKALYTPRELREIGDVVSALNRWGDKTGYNFSGTTYSSEFVKLVNSLFNFSVKGVATVGSQTLALGQVAEAMNNPQGRKALIELTKMGPKSDKAIKLAAYLSALSAGQEYNDTNQETSRTYQ